MQKEVKQIVIRADQLNSYIKEINQQSKLAILNDKEIKERAEGLLALHTPNKSDYAKKYEDIINSMSLGEKQSDEDPIEAVKSVDNRIPTVEIKPIRNEDELIKKLKEFRLQKSREENLKPYFIFNDKQMMDLINKLPISKEELMGVSGFGPVKTEKYGDVILKIINEHR